MFIYLGYIFKAVKYWDIYGVVPVYLTYLGFVFHLENYWDIYTLNQFNDIQDLSYNPFYERNCSQQERKLASLQ